MYALLGIFTTMSTKLVLVKIFLFYQAVIILYCVIDFDECAFGRSDCSENGTCTNLDGSFECACSEGFIGDGRVCYSESMIKISMLYDIFVKL